MKRLLLLLLLIAPVLTYAQVPSAPFLDPSRVIDWTSGVGFTIPVYSTPCSTPSLTAGSGAAASNAAAILAAINSCNGTTTNVVNLPAGTFYVSNINYNKKNNVVVRGAGSNLTYLFLTAGGNCNGYVGVGGCMGGNSLYAQSPPAAHGTGNTVCDWTAGYAKGSTSITLNNCDSPPQVGLIVTIDQAENGVDNNGYWTCSGFDNAQTASANGKCIQNGLGQNAAGRLLTNTGAFCSPGTNNSGNCLQYSQQQEVLMTAVSGSGTGPYTVTISNGVYFPDIASGRHPGAWWAPQNATHEGIENLTLDHSLDTGSNFGWAMVWCNQCWYQNIRSIMGRVNHVDMISSYQPVVQNNYFYGNQTPIGSNRYCVQMLEVSGGLVQNNIMHNTTSPDIKDAVTGSVVANNFTPYINFGSYMQGIYASHNSGSAYNLLEGNQTTSFLGDDVWGTSGLITIFRNQQIGWQPGYVNQTNGSIFNSGVRGINLIGNVLGQPGYHNQYEAYATGIASSSHTLVAGGSPLSGPGAVSTSLYESGFTDTSGLGVCTTPPVCDSLTHTSMMRWFNWDTVNGATITNTAEATPGSMAGGIAANALPATTAIPASFYLTSRPPWWTGPYPGIGPDITGGTMGTCSGGSFPGLWSDNASHCTGGTLSSAWAGHVNPNPAARCYFDVMNGPPDGSGSFLPFDSSACYSAAAVPIAGLVPSSMPFGNLIVGATSSPQVATLSNSGTVTLNITSIVITGDFAKTTTCGATLAAGANCTITVTFTPTATGARSGTVTVTDNSSGVPGSTQTIALTGTGTAPVAGVSPSSLTFAPRAVGNTSPVQNVTLSNTGNATLTIASITITGDYAKTTTCGGTLIAGGTCSISVTFTPTTTGTRTGNLVVTDNSGAIPGSTQTVPLTGTGGSLAVQQNQIFIIMSP